MQFKKSLFFLSFISCMFLSTSALAAQWGDFTYTVSSDNTTITITGYTGPGGAVVIPDNITGMPVVSIGDSAFYAKTTITRITIPTSVTGIGTLSFAYCSNLISLTIPNSIVSIGDTAFAVCSNLISVTIPDSVASIGTYVFYSCTSLTTVYLGAGVASIGEAAFYKCTGLTGAYFYGDAPTMGANVFYSCASGFTVYYTAEASGFTNPWYGYPTAVFDPSTITTTTTTTPFSTTTTSVSGQQWGDFTYTVSSDNTTITITGYTGAGGAVVIPDNITDLPVVSIGHYAFLNCRTMTSVTIPESVTTLGVAAFSNCGLTSITIPNSVTSIGNSAFQYCFGLTSVTIPASVRMINANAFASCTGLTSVTIPARSIGAKAFAYCTGLLSIAIPASVTSIGDQAFRGCTGLTSVTIPYSVENIETGAFSRCTSLANIDVDPSNSNYSSQDGVLYNKSKTTLIQYPCVKPGDFTIPSSVTSIGDGAFYDCSGLNAVIISNGITDIKAGTFDYCTGLTSIAVDPSHPAFSSQGGVLYDKAGSKLVLFPYGKAGAFTIPGGVTSIGDDAFYNCPGLTSVTIPGSVTSMYAYLQHCVGVCTSPGPLFCYNYVYTCYVDSYGSFVGCCNLTSVYFEGNAPNIINNNVSCDLPPWPVANYCSKGGLFQCSPTVFHREGATGFSNPWCPISDSNICYPTAIFDPLQTTTTTTTTTTIPAESCTVEFFPRRLSKMINTISPLQAIVIRGDEHSSFSRATEIDWGTSSVKTMLQAALGKRLIIALMLVNGKSQQVGDMYEVTVDNCTGELPVKMF